MKIFIFPFNKDDLSKFTEIFTIIPFLSEENYRYVLDTANTWNEGLYAKLRFYNTPFEYVKTIKESDLAVIPFKYDKNDKRVINYCEQAKFLNKKVVCFFNDDTGETFNLPENLYLFRTSIIKSLKHKNERALPVIVPDHFPSHTYLTETPENKIITFCGHVSNGRNIVLEKISSTYSDTNFIVRHGFWAPEVSSKQKAKQAFYNNLLSGSFSLCMRGNGNFSYRFYEALSFGRVPILIDTDCVLPFNDSIKWSDHILLITEKQINELPKLIEECTISPIKNRILWQTFFSAEGYFTNFIKDV